MTAELQATGVVLSSNPVTTLTADLVNHEVVLTTHGYVVRVGGQKLLDLIRFAQLAVEKKWMIVDCWRCGNGFGYFPEATKCTVCSFQVHCVDCARALHA